MGVDCSNRAGGRVHPPPLILERRSHWDSEADQGLRGTAGETRDELAADVNAGRCELWKINGGRAWMVTCVQRGPELVICCFEGEGLAAAFPTLYRIAQKNGCRTVRFFSETEAVARLIRRHGYRQRRVGLVYQCEVESV